MNDITNKSRKCGGVITPSGRSDNSSTTSSSSGTEPTYGGFTILPSPRGFGRAPQRKDYTKVPYVSGRGGKGNKGGMGKKGSFRTADAEMGKAVAESLAQAAGETDAARERVAIAEQEVKDLKESIAGAVKDEYNLVVDGGLKGFSFETHFISTNTPKVLVYKIVLNLVLLFILYSTFILYPLSSMRILLNTKSSWTWMLISFLYNMAVFYLCNWASVILIQWVAFHYSNGKDLLTRKARYVVTNPHLFTSPDDTRPEIVAVGKLKYKDCRLVELEILEDFVVNGVNFTTLEHCVKEVLRGRVFQYLVTLLVGCGRISIVRIILDNPVTQLIIRPYFSMIKLPDLGARSRGTVHIYAEMFAQLRSADLMVLSLDQEMGRVTKLYSEGDFYKNHSASLKMQFEKIQYSARRMNTLNSDRYDFLSGHLYVQETVKLAQVLYDDLRRIQYVQAPISGFPGTALH